MRCDFLFYSSLMVSIYSNKLLHEKTTLFLLSHILIISRLPSLPILISLLFCISSIARWSMFSSVDSPSYWHIFQHYAPPNTITSIEDMENVHTDVGRVRQI